MSEKVTKQYFCDFCGAEIDQTTIDGIRISNDIHNKGGLTIRPIKQYMDANRNIAIVIRDGDFCNVNHLMQFIERKLDFDKKARGLQYE